MKIYIQTVTHAEGAEPETRPRVPVLETAASREQVEQALRAVVLLLGRITAIPAFAHETNLKSLLPRDLAQHGVTTGTSPGGELVLQVLRKPEPAGPAGEIIALDYRVA